MSKLILVVLAAAFFMVTPAARISADVVFNRLDRVLVLAPHPDDEAIGVGGAIKRALTANAQVKVACFTCGDNNEIAFLIYKKHPVLSAKGLIAMGETRRKETLAAMTGMGLKGEDIIFMGYPDFGTLSIFTSYWGDAKPYEAMLTKQTKVPYREAMSYGAPYVGESVLKDLKQIITEFKPTVIFVSHPADSNCDHKALYLFLQVALWDLGDAIKPAVYPYIVHVVGWPAPRGYHPTLALEPPRAYKEISWSNLYLSQDEITAKHDAISKYKSQISCNPPYLFTFARKNEIFGDFKPIDLQNGDDKGIYSIKDEKVIVKLYLAGREERNEDFTVYLIGYKKGISFSAMPKLHIRIEPDNFYCRDKHRRLYSNEGIALIRGPKTLTLQVCLSTLGFPDYIFANVGGRTENMSDDDTKWRILKLK